MNKPKTLESIDREFLEFKKILATSSTDSELDVNILLPDKSVGKMLAELCEENGFDLNKRSGFRKKRIIITVIIILLIVFCLTLLALYFINEGFTVPFTDTYVKHNLVDVPVIGKIISFIEKIF